MIPLFSLRNLSFGAFFSKLIITCQITLLVHLKLFECALLVHIRSNALHQKCVCESNSTRGSELLQTLFCTKNHTPSYYVLKLFFIKNLCDSLLYYKTNAEHPIFVITVCQLLWIRMDHQSKASADPVS